MAPRKMKRSGKKRKAGSAVISCLHHHFIPHEGNGFVPKALRHKNLFAYSAIIVALKVLLVALPAVIPGDFLYSSAISEANVVALTNQSRSANGLVPLAINPMLTQAAQAKADDMIVRQYFAHVGPDGEQAWDWMRRAGYAYRFAGENLALYFTSAEETYAGWLASPTHRANILSEKYSQIGIGVAQGEFNGYPTFIVVQLFGLPSGVEIPGTVAVQPEPETSELPEEFNGSPIGEEQTVLGTRAAPPDIERTDILPTDDGLLLTATINGATEARVVSQQNIFELEKQDADTWQATLTPPDSEQEWRLLARSASGAESVRPAALMMPSAEIRSVYGQGFDAGYSPALLKWVNYPNLQTGVNAFYVYMAALLLSAMLLKFFIKIRVQRWSVLAHASAVVAIAVFMTML